jgi:hypothetical protein
MTVTVCFVLHRRDGDPVKRERLSLSKGKGQAQVLQGGFNHITVVLIFL